MSSITVRTLRVTVPSLDQRIGRRWWYFVTERTPLSGILHTVKIPQITTVVLGGRISSSVWMRH